MTAPALSKKALHLSYEIPMERFSELPPSPGTHLSTYAADILVHDHPDYPDIPSSIWTVALRIYGTQVSASVDPKEPTGTKPANTVMVNWKVGLEGELFDGQIGPNAWAPAAKSSGALSGLLASSSRCGICGSGYCYQLDKGRTVFVSLTFVVERPAYRLDPHVFSDCTLVCETKELPAHRAILAAQSPVFAAMFQNQMKEKTSGICKIDDIRLEVLETLVQCAYTRAPLKSDGTLQELWIAADKYDMKELRIECERTMLQSVTAETAFQYLCFAEEHGMKNLRAEAAKCISKQPL